MRAITPPLAAKVKYLALVLILSPLVARGMFLGTQWMWSKHQLETNFDDCTCHVRPGYPDSCEQVGCAPSDGVIFDDTAGNVFHALLWGGQIRGMWPRTIQLIQLILVLLLIARIWTETRRGFRQPVYTAFVIALTLAFVIPQAFFSCYAFPDICVAQ